MTDTKLMLLPQNSWKKNLLYMKEAYEGSLIRKLDVRGKVYFEDINFLEELGIFSKKNAGQLTKIGNQVVDSHFIRCNEKEKEILFRLLLDYKPVTIIQQRLWGVADVTVDKVLIILKSSGIWKNNNKKNLTNLLDLLNYIGIIVYNRRLQKIKINISPNDLPSLPKNILVTRESPFANIFYTKKVLKGCKNFIYWLDKNFQKEAFEWIWSIADANKIKEIKILSLNLGKGYPDKNSLNYYKRLQKELSNKGIKLTWALIDKELIRDDHDRWILGKNNLWNVPDVNTIFSGNLSELNNSKNFDKVIPFFKNYWKKAKEIRIDSNS